MVDTSGTAAAILVGEITKGTLDAHIALIKRCTDKRFEKLAPKKSPASAVFESLDTLDLTGLSDDTVSSFKFKLIGMTSVYPTMAAEDFEIVSVGRYEDMALPKRKHDCYAAQIDGIASHFIYRCPCGGIKTSISDGWEGKNRLAPKRRRLFNEVPASLLFFAGGSLGSLTALGVLLSRLAGA